MHTQAFAIGLLFLGAGCVTPTPPPQAGEAQPSADGSAGRSSAVPTPTSASAAASPHFATAAPVNWSVIDRISRFRSGAGGMFPMIRPSRIDGAVVVHYRLARGDERAVGSLAKAFPDRLAGPFGRGINTGVMVAVSNLAQAEERRRQAESMAGIDELEALAFTDIVYPSAFESYLEARVALLQDEVEPR